MAEHTPLPWFAYFTTHGDPYVADYGRLTVVATVATGPDDYGRANAEFIVRAVNNYDEMLAALEAMVEFCGGMDGEVYGSFHGGDPRRFKPEEEECSPEEIAAWKAACAEWDEGRGVDRGPGCLTFGDGSAVTGTGFGVGVTTLPEAEEITQAKAAIAKAKKDAP